MDLVAAYNEKLENVAKAIDTIDGFKVYRRPATINFLKGFSINYPLHFIVHAHGKGLIVLHVMSFPYYRVVKGSHQLRLTPSDNWKPQRSPFRSLASLVYRMKMELDKIAPSLYFPFTGCLVFPDSSLKNGLLPPAFPRSSLLFAEDFQDDDRLRKAILDNLETVSSIQTGRNPHIADNINNQIAQALGRISQPLNTVGIDGTNKMDLLTQAQADIFAKFADKRMTVVGMAGSGKTVLALGIAKRWAQFGGKAAYLCRNKLLKRWMERNNDGNGIDFITSEDFTSRILEISGQSYPVKLPAKTDRPELADTDSLRSFKNCISPLWHCLVVDEAQDFEAQDLDIMAKSVHDDGCFHIYFDADQITSVDGRFNIIMPNFGSPFKLEKNCRNTRKINDIAKVIADKFGQARPESVPWATDGEPPRVSLKQSDLKKQIITTINKWLSIGFDPSAIAILTLAKRNESILNSIPSFSSNNHPQSKTSLFGDGGCVDGKPIDDWCEGKGVFWTTARAFKGLEARCVLVCEIPEKMNDDCWRSLYVAVTRAKSNLAVITGNDSQVTEFTINQ